MDLVDKVRDRIKNRRGKSYQEKRDNDANWTLIEKHIDTSCRNLLDIACDLGFYSFKAADKGLFTLGFDILAPSLKKAFRQVADSKQDNIAFMKMRLSPDNIALLPKFDIILCLSVYQHFCRNFGEIKARQMVAKIFAKCNRQLFFQIPSKRIKFGPDFSIDFENDQSKIEGYVNELFDDIGDCSVKMIGKKPEKPPGEPWRYLFLIDKVES